MNRLIEGFRPNDAREVVRIVAGILIAVGMVVVAFRRDSPGYFEDTTSNFGMFVIFGLPAVFLYGAGILGRILGAADRRWQALYTVTGMLLLPISLFFLMEAIDSGYDGTLFAIFIFGLCALACGAAWLIASIRFQLLLGAVYAAIAWLALLDKVLSDGLESDLSTIRGLLLVFAGALAVAAVFARRRATAEPEAAFGELLTGAGIAALIAFSLGPGIGLYALDSGLGYIAGQEGFVDPQQETIWDVLTLLTGTGLILFGIGRGLRGQVYVGAAMLLVFVTSVGLDLDDATPEGKIVGWPLLLCIVGAAGFVVSLLPGDRIPPALGLGRFFQGGRDDPEEGAAAPTWQQPPENAEPEPATEAQPVAGESEAQTSQAPEATAEPPTEQSPPPTVEPPTEQAPPEDPEAPAQGGEPPRT